MVGRHPAVQLLTHVGGYIVTQCLFTAAQLGLADRLAQRPQSAAELAAATGTDAGALYRLLRTLASIDVFERTPQDTFLLGPLGQLLRSDVEGSLRSWVLFNGGLLYRPFGEMPFSLASGRPATERVFGAGLFDHLEATPEDATLFDDAMADFARRSVPGILAACDLSTSRHVVDVGGGSGELLAGMLRAHRGLHGTLVDREHALAGARRTFEDAGLLDRCTFVAGDFFAEVPAGGDTYVLAWILHDWNDADAVTILRNVRAAIGPTGRLLVIESVLPEGDAPNPARILDMVMLVALGGQERDAAQYSDLLQQAGFRLNRILETGGARSIIEALPI